MSNAYPSDLANVLCKELHTRQLDSPDEATITRLLEVLYFTSLKTEEGQSITCHICWLNPANPDPDPPERIVHERWNYVPLNNPIEYSVKNLTKISQASDPRTSSFAVYFDTENELHIYGLIDQGNHYHNFINYDRYSSQYRPGVFQANILGIGHIAVSIELSKIAELKTNLLIYQALDVLGSGPVYDKLQPGISAYIDAIKQMVPTSVFEERQHWTGSLQYKWNSSLCRLLLRMQGYKHGGALLITSGDMQPELNVKYRISYDRLTQSLHSQGVHRINTTYANDRIHEDYLERRLKKIPTYLYLNSAVEENEANESEDELDGALWFVSLLSRVDGLVLLTPQLEVEGFGVEITSSREPEHVYLAGDVQASKENLHRIDYKHFGTRHRSMMRYCLSNENSVGFVVSQDGDVRVITNVDGNILLWYNVKLIIY